MKSYQDLLRDILATGTYKSTRAVDPATGKNIGAVSVFGRMWKHDLATGYPLLTTKKMFFTGIMEELLWFLRGEQNVKSLQERGVKIWDAWAYDPEGKFGGRKEPLYKGEKEGSVGPTYGSQWRKWSAPKTVDEFFFHASAVGTAVATSVSCFDDCEEHRLLTTYPIDQIANVIAALKANPNDRRLLVTAWNPADNDKIALPPCHYAFQLSTHMKHLPGCVKKLRDFPITCACDPVRRLDCMVQMRSTDAFLGLPFNIASYAMLTHVIAQVVGMEVGELTFSFGDLHIYENHLDQVAEQLNRDPMALPQLFVSHTLKDIDELTSDKIALLYYVSHPAIKAAVGV